MKILFIINRLGGGGAERVLALVANSLSNYHDVSILSFHPKTEKYRLNKNIVIIEKEIKKNNPLLYVKSINKTVREILPQIIISFEYHMNIKMLLATVGNHKAKKIISERNDPAHKGGRPILKQLRNIMYRSTDVLVCQTEDAKNYFPGSIRKRAVIIPNPISDELPEPWGGERERKVVNFCRLEKQKNLPLLIESFAIFHKKHNDYALEIYGDGTERENLEEIIRRRGLEKHVRLYHATQDVHLKVLKAEMFVSTSDYEGLSNSMLESLALGVPTIATDCPCGGARMFIKDGSNGFLCRINDAVDISNKMNILAENKDIRTRFSDESIRIRKALSKDKITKMWESLL